MKIFKTPAFWYSFIIVVSYILLKKIVIIKTATIYDAGNYIYIADSIGVKGFLSFSDSHLRTYGYPLFLFLVFRLSGLLGFAVDRLEIVVFIQFIFHTFTSFLAVSILKKFKKKISLAAKLFCFGLIQFNPFLLGMSQEVLTETLATFFTVLFFWAFLSDEKYRSILAGMSLACAIVIRPVNEAWLFAFGALLLLFGLLLKWTRDVQILSRPTLKSCVGFFTPLVIIVGMQFFITYKNHKVFSLLGGTRYFVRENLIDTSYLYKRETFVGDSKIHPVVTYEPRGVKKEMIKCLSNGNYLSCWMSHPITFFSNIILKTTGLFQNYEWTTYRKHLKNEIGYVFLFGLVNFFMFIYINLENLREWFAGKNPQVSWREAFFLIGIDSFILLVSIFALPASRYINPIIPIIISFGFYILAKRWKELSKLTLIVSLGLAFLLYFAAYVVLLQSRVVNPL